MNPSASSIPTDTDRLRRLAHLVEDVARRRSGGESVSDDAVIEAHPDLMPELGDNLRALDRVEEARCEARSRTTMGDGSTSLAGISHTGFVTPSPHSFPGFEKGFDLMGDLARKILKSRK